MRGEGALLKYWTTHSFMCCVNTVSYAGANKIDTGCSKRGVSWREIGSWRREGKTQRFITSHLIDSKSTKSRSEIKKDI